MGILYDFNKATKYRTVLVPWNGKTLKISAGTPVNAHGAVVTDGTAIGLTADKLTYSENVRIYSDGKYYAEAKVLTEGYVDIVAAQNESGLTYSDELKAALAGITFVDEKLSVPSASQLVPGFTAADNGKVLTVIDGACVWAELPTEPDPEPEA